MAVGRSDDDDDRPAEGSGFLSRWSQRKAAARQADDAEAPPAAEAVPAVAEEPVVAEELPPVESLEADSDFTPYLRKGVPEAMRRAALRKLWVTEPSVVNYRPLVEYAWHDNEPGFGPLLPTDDVEKLLRQIFGTAEDPPKDPAGDPAGAAGPADAASIGEQVAAAPPLPPSGDEAVVPAAEPEPVRPEAVQRRRHGGALPG